MTAKQRISVTEEWIREYAKSIDAPLQFVHKMLIAPSTMPILFWSYFNKISKHTALPLLHGSQQFVYNEPITSEMILDCTLTLIKTEKKDGNSGPLTLFTYQLTFHCEGKKIGTATSTLIQVGAIHEKIHHN